MDKPKGWDRAHKAAAIIEAARQREQPPLSQSKAAARAGIVEGWWGVAIRGSRRQRGGNVLIVPKDHTLIAMARVVGAEPDVREALGLDPVEPSPPISGPPIPTARAYDQGDARVIVTRADGSPFDDAAAAEILRTLSDRLDVAFAREAARYGFTVHYPEGARPGS